MEVPDGLVGGFLGLLEDAGRLKVGRLQDLIFGGVELGQPLIQLDPGLIDGGFGRPGLGLGLLDGDAAVLQVGQQVFEGDALLIDTALGVADDVRGQSQLRGNGEGIGLAWNADQKPVGGGEGLQGELTGGIFYALG